MMGDALTEDLRLARLEQLRQLPHHRLMIPLAEGQRHDIGCRKQHSLLCGMPKVFHKRRPILELSHGRVDEHHGPDGQLFSYHRFDQLLQSEDIGTTNTDHLKLLQRLNLDGDLGDQAGDPLCVSD